MSDQPANHGRPGGQLVGFSSTKERRSEPVAVGRESESESHARAKSELAVSVIVPVRNGREELRALLDALSMQTLGGDRFEVIVGDDGSTDGSIEEVVKEYDWARVTPGPPLNSYAARNRAAALSHSGALAFCDSDCVPEPRWLETGLEALRSADVAGGLIRLLVPDRPTVWTLLDIDMHLDQERSVRSGQAATANLFVTRQFFEGVGGFDDSLPNGSDYDFVSRCVARGARLSYAPEAVVWHPTRDSARAFLTKVWRIHRAHGIRQRRRGERPKLLRFASIPIVGMMRSRKATGRPLNLDRRRLAANRVRPRFRHSAGALVIMYLVLPYLARAARFRGRRMSSSR